MCERSKAFSVSPTLMEFPVCSYLWDVCRNLSFSFYSSLVFVIIPLCGGFLFSFLTLLIILNHKKQFFSFVTVTSINIFSVLPDGISGSFISVGFDFEETHVHEIEEPSRPHVENILMLEGREHGVLPGFKAASKSDSISER